jgi:trigger factor
MLQQMKNYGNVNLGDKEIDGIVANILNNEKESERMMNELIAIRLIDYFKSKMKLNSKTVTFNEFVKLVNNKK